MSAAFASDSASLTQREPYRTRYPLTRRLLLAAVVLLPAIAAPASAQSDPAQASTLAKIRGTNVITIGHRVDAVPFAYLDANKQPIGYGIDVCAEVVSVLRRDLKLPALRVEYVPVTAANRFQIVNSGAADMECGLTVNNPERRKDAGFTIPYFFAGPRILTRVDSGIRDFVDLRGKRVVSAKGANAIPILRKRIESRQLMNTVLQQVDSNTQAFALLEKGEADAFVTTDNLLYAYRATARDPNAYHVVGTPLVVEAVAIVTRRGDAEFKRAVDRALTGLMLDGVVSRHYRKWFMSPVPTPGSAEMRVIDIPMSALLRDQIRWPSDRTGDE
jgi:ABC-type amino acid transport substrate-binding protein